MNRLSAPLWANVVVALYGTQHLSEEKEKESKIKEKITKLREEIVWLPIVKQL